MPAGAMSSLGLGSGVLTYDVIDKLKKADQANLINPIDKKISSNSEKQKELALLIGSLTSIRTITNKLSDTSTYLQRKATVTGDGVKASAGVGLALQDIKIQVEKLAKNDVYELGMKYSSRDASFSSDNTNMALYKDGLGDISIKIASNTSLADVGQKITDATNGSVAGIIMKTGGANPYQLMLNSTKTGVENKLYLGSTFKTNALINGDIGTGTITLGYRDHEGVDKEISITINDSDSTPASTASDNAKMIRDKLRAALYDSASSNNLVFMPQNSYTSTQRNAPIHIDIAGDGKTLIINDTRGTNISLTVSGALASSGILGSSTTRSAQKMETLDTGRIEAGVLSGKFYIGGVLINLSPTSGTSPKANALDIISQINAIKPEGFTAELNKTEDGFTLAKRISGNNSALSSIGIKAGILDGVVKSSDVAAGQLSGVVTIAGIDIDLSTITSTSNTSAQNAAAIAAALNGQNGLSVSASGNSFVITNTNRSVGIYKYDDGNPGNSPDEIASAELLSKLKLKAGTYKSYAHFFEFTNSGTSKFDNIQPAQDAEFYYNDVKITRSGNRIDDIVSGLTLELSKTHNISQNESATVRIEQDLGSITDDVKKFVESYNEVVKKLAEYTKYDPDTKVSGIFQGESRIYTIKSTLNTLLTYADGKNNSLVSFGIYLNEDGTLKVDEEKLKSKIFANTEETERFFRGYVDIKNGKEIKVDGVFRKLTDRLDKFINGSNSVLKLFESKLEDEYKKLNEDKKNTTNMIETKYEMMAARFAAYDSIIAKLNASFQSLQMQITQMINSK